MRTFFGPSIRRFGAKIQFVASLTVFTAMAAILIAAPSQAQAKANKFAAFVIDAKTGKTLYSRNADARRYPASLTKMMTLYLVFEDLKRGKIRLGTPIRVSRFAANQPPSKLGLKPGQTFTVQQGIFALVTKSANDVATAIGEKLSGSEAAFARRMTLKARQLGMKRTTFKNANGLPNRRQVTTARDMSKLGLALREHFPKQFKYFKTKSYQYGRRRFPNHNKLLGRVKGVDGIKTGYTRASGFNLVSSVSRGKRRIVAVIMGGKTGRQRNAQMTRIISKYLPKASRGKSRVLIARAKPPSSKKAKKTILAKKQVVKKNTTMPVPKSSPKRTSNPAPVTVVATTLPTAKPLISKKFIQPGRVEIAHQASAYASTSINASAIYARLKEIGTKSLPLPMPNPKNYDSIVTGSVVAIKKTKPNPVVVSAKRSGWQIQVGATPNRKSANRLLTKARKKAKTLLASASNYLEPVVKGNSTLIRARFTGFSSKTKARRACKILKKRKIACLAIYQ